MNSIFWNGPKGVVASALLLSSFAPKNEWLRGVRRVDVLAAHVLLRAPHVASTSKAAWAACIATHTHTQEGVDVRTLRAMMNFRGFRRHVGRWRESDHVVLQDWIMATLSHWYS